MRRVDSAGLWALVIALGSGGAGARGADSAADTALKGKGLTKSGQAYVIEAEKPILAKIKDVRNVFNMYASVVDRQAAADQLAKQSSELEDQRSELQMRLDSVNERILEQGVMTSNVGNQPGMGRGGQGGGQQQQAYNPLIVQRTQLQAGLLEVTRNQKAVKAQSSQVKDRAALDDEVKKREEAFKTALADLRKQVDEVSKKYTELAADPTVKAAMDEVKKTLKGKIKLGPSDAFLAVGKELDQAERRFLGKSTAPAASKKKARAKAKART